MKKRLKKYFPMHFYGDYDGWRFIIRAYDETEVLAALRWKADISVKREKFHLFEIATEVFTYNIDNFLLIDDPQDYNRGRRCIGPVIEVKTLNKLYSS